MTSSTLDIEKAATLVGMGQIAVCNAPDHFKTILGSCIGVVIYHPRIKIAVMAHIVMPESDGRNGPPGKFADTAIPHMLQLLKERDTPMRELVAKYTGGANMFGSTGPMQIGLKNAEAVAQGLQTAGIKVLAQETGAKKGRRVIFNCTTGIMTVASAGEPDRTL